MAIHTVINQALNLRTEQLHYAPASWYSWPMPTNPSATDDLHIQIAPRPAAISPTNSRFTFAADLTFPTGYFGNDARHLVVVAGVSGGDPWNSNDTVGWSGAIIGSLWNGGKIGDVGQGIPPSYNNALAGTDGGTNYVMHEERRGVGPNLHQWRSAFGAIQPGQKLRVVVDRIQRGSTVTSRIRVYPLTAGALAAPLDSGDIPCYGAMGTFTNRDVEHIGLVDVARAGRQGPTVHRVAAYWSNANEDVVNP